MASASMIRLQTPARRQRTKVVNYRAAGAFFDELLFGTYRGITAHLRPATIDRAA